MRKSKQEASETRKAIVRTAGQEFRRRGIGATSLADLMSAAGLTHGGFYRHFASKDQLVAEACAVAVTETGAQMAEAGDLESAVRLYLSEWHRDHPGEGCAIAALGGEIARADEATREAATQGLLKLVEVASGQSDRDPLVMVATLVGAVTLGRMVSDPNLSAAILAAATHDLLSRRSPLQ